MVTVMAELMVSRELDVPTSPFQDPAFQRTPELFDRPHCLLGSANVANRGEALGRVRLPLVMKFSLILSPDP
jgi:hypothetical protein